MSDAFRSKPALKRCAVCRLPVARKKLVFAPGGQPVLRACQSTAHRSSTRSATSTGLTRAPKDISRAELLKRIEALRKRDAKMNPGAAKVQPTGRPKPPTGRAAASGRSPRPSRTTAWR